MGRHLYITRPRFACKRANYLQSYLFDAQQDAGTMGTRLYTQGLDLVSALCMKYIFHCIQCNQRDRILAFWLLFSFIVVLHEFWTFICWMCCQVYFTPHQLSILLHICEMHIRLGILVFMITIFIILQILVQNIPKVLQQHCVLRHIYELCYGKGGPDVISCPTRWTLY